MSFVRKLLAFSVFALFIPFVAQAQDGRLEINAGISTAGNYMLTDYDFTLDEYDSKFSDGVLNHLKEESYYSKVYPSVSAEIAYRLSDDGTLSRLSVVGMAGLHIADYEPKNIVSGSYGKQTAIKADALLGVRFRIVETSHLTMYSQAMAGIDFRNGSDYWTVTGNTHSQSSNELVYQLTFLGFRVKLGRRNSHLGFITELGYGSEYVLSKEMALLSPGMRAGISYRF
jgi:hypothetical protein